MRYRVKTLFRNEVGTVSTNAGCFLSAVQARCGCNNMQMALGGDSGPLWGVRRAVQRLSLWSETPGSIPAAGSLGPWARVELERLHL